MLALDNLTKTFHIHTLGGKVIEALRGISLKVAPGEFLGLSGPSGAGKSTILKCIYRTYLPTAGDIWYESRDCGRINLATTANRTVLGLRSRELGYVSQFFHVIPRVSALEVVAEPLVTRNGILPSVARRKAAELLQRLQIPPSLMDAYPATFSGGEQQRVNIAKAVIWKPRLLLLDEPTASLDLQATAVVMEILRELKEEGTTMIGIFHRQDMVRQITDRLYEIGGQQL
ncbi:MAG: phosphonate C-P lyase system protein PhnL [Desulfobaccales bacterium]